MAQYQVPQFLEVEDKIFGPLTLKQFLYSFGGGGVIFISWILLPKLIAIIVGVPIGLFFLAMAFYKVNGRPFVVTVENALKYSISSKLYIWKKEDKKPIKKDVGPRDLAPIFVPKLSDSKLRDISWELDIHEKLEEAAEDAREEAHKKTTGDKSGLHLEI